jgi:nucleoside-diphosphate-sugar epimerase
MKDQRIFLVSGFPLPTVKHFVLHALSQGKPYIALLVPEKFESLAKAFVEKHNLKQNLRVVVGDVAIMHLGFSSEEYRFLLKNVTDIYHFASIYYQNSPDELIHRVNIEGTKNIIRFARDCQNNPPLNYLSTCMVFENHSGLVPEEPVKSPSFNSFIYKSRYIAESMIMSEPINWRIFRAPYIAGDSRTGETEKLDGFYALIYLLMLTHMKLPIPVPNRGKAPLNIIPIDYLVKAIYHISSNPDSINRIFHIVDPHPISIETALELLSRYSGRKIDLFYPPVDIIKPLVKFKIFRKLTPSYAPLFDILSQFIIFSHSNTDMFLKDSNIETPSFESYINPMLDFVKKRVESRKKKIEEGGEEDPYNI